MSNVRVSFVLPVYRPDLEILRKCAKALVAQSLREWEAIFVIDGDFPEAATVIRSEFKKSKNHFKIVEIEHSGAQAARNEGFQHTKGEFICTLDSDCVIEPDTAKTWVDTFDKHQDAAFVYSGYAFMDNGGAIPSEPFDEFTLKVRNYISGCFPVRRSFYPGWRTELKSLQDWCFWLDVVAKGGKGKFLPGYAFTTALPKPGSISGEGCKDDVWLERVDAVKKIHGLPERDVCVSSLLRKHEGVWLAKLIGADYQDVPNFKPHRYKTIIQLGFSFLPQHVEVHCGIFSEPHVKKIVFFSCDDVAQVTNRLNLQAVWKYSTLLNAMARLYVEDKTAYDVMRKAGFNVEIMPLPVEVGEVPPMPEKRRVGVDCAPEYGPVFDVLQKSLPDVELISLKGAHKIADLTALAHFHPDRTMSLSMKRAALAGRGVVSNVQSPFMGYIDDGLDLKDFMPKCVEKIRELAYNPVNPGAREYYKRLVGAEKLLEVCK
jgi:glycosyltransferase involved in cell wall biosynthesis